MIKSVNHDMVVADTEALLAALAKEPDAAPQPYGQVGYCMSGRYAVSAAVQFPDRVKAAASIYGTHLMTDEPDSPHRTALTADAELYFACAEFDRWVPLETIDPLRQTLAAGGVKAEVELYPGAHHGFAFPKRPVYHRDAAERHWERLLALYRRNLVP